MGVEVVELELEALVEVGEEVEDEERRVVVAVRVGEDVLVVVGEGVLVGLRVGVVCIVKVVVGIRS